MPDKQINHDTVNNTINRITTKADLDRKKALEQLDKDVAKREEAKQTELQKNKAAGYPKSAA